MLKLIYRIGSFSLALFIFSCTTPRSVLNSGKVVPKNTVRGGINYTFNIATSPIAKSATAIYNFADNYQNKDTIYFDQSVEDVNAALLSYCLDPITFTNEYYVRFGMGHRMDMGYRNSGDAHGVDVMYQEGMRLYKAGDYESAANKFQDVEDVLPDYKKTHDLMTKARQQIRTPVAVPSKRPSSSASPSPSREEAIKKSLDLFDPRN